MLDLWDAGCGMWDVWDVGGDGNMQGGHDSGRVLWSGSTSRGAFGWIRCEGRMGAGRVKRDRCSRGIDWMWRKCIW
jgi:hypothetical protein